MSLESESESESTEAQQSNDASAASDDASSQSSPSGRSYPVTAKPTVRPTLVWLAIVIVAGGGVAAAVVGNPDVFGGADQANVVANAVLLLTALGVIRFLIRIYVLRRTEYVVDERSLIRRYSLLLRTWRREVPLSMVRSHQLKQGRIQKLLGYGTISVNQGLGDLRFENVKDPIDVNDVIAEQVSQAAGRGHSS
ncbi:MAG: PH domain-containing protein [Halobaculum sp.]